jgi:cytochrome c oxidase subunit II
MWQTFPLFPQQASTTAGQVDLLFFFLIGVSAFFVILIFVLIAYFCVKYRRRPGHTQSTQTATYLGLEVAWTGIPLMLTVVMFVWGAKIFFNEYNPPAGAMDISVVGKQWMWKFQHPEGRREINELHVPRGRPIKLTMISEDVIHDLFVPSFRMKRDVLPGRYSTAWFQATKTGTYHLFCAQYCGTSHSKMGGWVFVMEPADYAQWLSGIGAGEPLAVTGERLFQQLGCATCHLPQGTGRGPSLVGAFGGQVKLASGETALVNEDYIREMILRPGVKVVAGYQPIMPTFKGIVSEEGVQQLIAYMKSLDKEEGVKTP